MIKSSPLSKDHKEAIGPADQYEKEKVPRYFEPAARFFLKYVPLQKHDRVLDVACGTGIVARLVAGQPGFEGSITGLDIDSNMLAVARATAASAGGGRTKA
jgi:2-polyprenyl-3-methyl-5-hydroxy-6-metoxy-1,4-benzoquinol methylase